MVNDIADMDLLEMLRVGQPVPSAVIPTMHTYKRNLMQRVETHRKEYAAAAAKLRHCEGLFAPIRALPRELLMHIFTLTGDTSAARMGARTVIGRVCRHWRSITASSPAFWSKIDISYAGGRVPNLHALAQCLVLSYPHLLDVTLDIHSDISEEYFYLLDNHTSRLRSLKCLCPCTTVDFVFAILGKELLNLESLEVRYRGEYDSKDLYLIELDAPALHTVLTNLPSCEFRATTTLTTFSGAFNHDKHFYSFLCDAKSLTTLHVVHIGPNPDIASFPFSPHVLVNLRKLSLQFCAISPAFQYFEFPNLECFAMPNTYTLYDMEFHPTRCVGSAYMDIIRGLIQRSGCSLRHLEIGNLIPPSTFLQPFMMPCISAVTTLHLEFHSESSDDILPAIELLTVPENVDGVVVLPHLTDLIIVICSSSTEHILFKQEQTQRMIGSRWGSAVSRLKRLRLEGKVYPEGTMPLTLRSSSLKLFLRGLKRDGLDVTWIVEGDDMLVED